MANTIQQATEKKPAKEKAKQSLNTMLNAFLDREGMQKRFNELLGERTPTFISSLVSLINASPQLQKAFYEAPLTVIQAALKAATYDLPIDPALGYAYIVPFNNTQSDGSKRAEATFILGYKGMLQLAMRTGVYQKINVCDIREEELAVYDRLKGDYKFNWIYDEKERAKAPIMGYAAYFRLINGMEQEVYMSIGEIEEHEKRFRKGKYRGKGWNDDFNAMCRKTVLRKLLGKWGILSIDYKTADKRTIAAAKAIESGNYDDEDNLLSSMPFEAEEITAPEAAEISEGQTKINLEN